MLFALFKMNQTQETADSIVDHAHHKGCVAAEYGYCSANDVKDRTVIFMRRNIKIGCVPEEEVKVSMCGFHYTWLVAITPEPLEMCGCSLDTAIGEDLCSAFEPSDPFTFKSRLFTFWHNSNTEVINDHCIFNGNDTDHAPARFERGWKKAGVIHYNSQTGFLQVLEPISKAMCHIIAEENNNGELYFYTLPNEGVHTHRREQLIGVDCWCLEVEDIVHFFENPIVLPDDILNYATSARIQFKTSDRDARYNECLDFILVSVSEDIMEMASVNEKNCESPVSLSTRKAMLFDCAATLMLLLSIQDKENIDCLRSTLSEGTDFASILWFVYTYTNHILYTSYDEIGKFNSQLVDLFLEEGLEKQLLAIAISGERERYIDNKQRTHHDILCESETVVKALVPEYVSTDDIIKQERDNDGVLTLTPIQYWHYFDEKVFNVCTLEEETFEKNKAILEYLKLNRE